MKAFCCECGHPVPQIFRGGKWEIGKCRRHPMAKRYSQSMARRWFAVMRETLAAIKDAPGLVYRGAA